MDWNTLDITDEKGKDFEALYHTIVDGVLSTQMFLIRDLPSILLVTPEQFNILRPSEDFVPTDELLWRTLHPKTGDIINVMDVYVKGVFEPKRSVLLLNQS